MKNVFSYYHQQNEIILKVLLLPLTLVIKLSLMLFKVIIKQATNLKH